MFDNRLTWAAHVTYINKKLRKCIYMLSTLSRVLELAQLKTVYYAYVQSLLQYGIICWGGTFSTIIQPLLITQKSIIKAALKKPLKYPTYRLFQNFQVLDVRQLFIKVLVLYTFKNNFSFLQKNEHIYPTRYNINLGITTPRIHKSISAKSSYYIAHVIYGRLPTDLRVPGACSLATYKGRLEKWLLETGRDSSADMIVSDYVC